MHHAPRCRSALEATVHSVAWKDLKRHKPFINHAAEDVKDEMFWKRIFIHLRALYPFLKLLRMADSNKPNMDKVCFYLHLTREHLVKSRDNLCRDDIFPSSYKSTKEVEADASYEDDEGGVDENNDELDDGADVVVEEQELDVYTVNDEWGTIVPEELKGIFKPIINVIAKRTPKFCMTLLTLLTFVLSVPTLLRMLRGGLKEMVPFAMRLRTVLEGFSVMTLTEMPMPMVLLM
jgi:hypothetical protein